MRSLPRRGCNLPPHVSVLVVIVFLFGWTGPAVAQSSFADLKAACNKAHQATHDHLYRDKYVKLTTYAFDEKGERRPKSIIEYRSNRTKFVIETTDIATQVSTITVLTSGGIAQLLRQPSGVSTITQLSTLPSAAGESAEQVKWHKIDRNLESVGIGFFHYGSNGNSVLESILDPKAPATLPPNVKIDMKTEITINLGDGRGSVRKYTNGDYVLATNAKLHSNSSRVTLYENNTFDGWKPVLSEVYWTNDSDGKRMDLSRVEVNQWEVKSHDDSLFRLSRYGLPEIDDGELPVQPPYLLYGGIALGLLVAVGVAAFFIKKYGTNKSA